MDSFDCGTPEPNIKFEPSPAESFMSTPGGEYPSLFGNSPMPSTMNPRDMMTPDSSHGDECHNANASHSAGDRNAASCTPEPGAGEKKQTKKRKSWGQVLPEPKTNLPPRYVKEVASHLTAQLLTLARRKRAKTEDEKEQRRVERVLRNRRAAQSSRERKRQEVEALEKKNQELVDKLERANSLIQELFQRLGSSGNSPSIEALRPNPITFSQELFNSQDGHMASQQTSSSLMDGILMTQSSNTVNPASLSPTLCPVPEEEEEDWLAHNEPSTPAAAPAAEAPATTEETFPDATQLPAAKLCSDLQCRSAEVPPQWQPTTSAQALWLFQILFLPLQLSIISACRQPLLQVAMSTRAGFSLPPTPAILNTIIWLVTTRRHPSTREAATTTTSTSPSSSTTTSTSPASANSSSSTVPTTARAPASRSPTLRLRSLLRILSCSPLLARPLRDATLEVLRLVVSRQTRDVDAVDGADWSATVKEDGQPSPPPRQQQEEESEYLRHVPAFYRGRLPSVEALFTLAWICEVELKKQTNRRGGIKVEARRSAVASGQESRAPPSLSGLMKPECPTWEAERGFDLGPNPGLTE